MPVPPPPHTCVISHLLEVLPPRSQYDFTDFNLRLFVGNLSSMDDTIVLSLCRFEKDANAECRGKPEGTLQDLRLQVGFAKHYNA